jgi:hypothetical protein
MRVLHVVACLVLGLSAACGPKADAIEPSGPPPLPPASGTPIGYLVDAKADLSLRDDQLAKLQDLDSSLAAENGSLDAQLRQIEKPMPGAELSPQQQKAGETAPRYDNAPGRSTITTDDSQKLRKLHDENEQRAIEKAFTYLDEKQVVIAKRILQDRGIRVPGAGKAEPPRSADDGAPLPGMDQ